MWTCEGIDFTQSPEYWLVQISALPFGTFGEMLGADNTPPTPVRTYTIISILEVSQCERLTGTQRRSEHTDIVIRFYIHPVLGRFLSGDILRGELCESLARYAVRYDQ